MIITYLSRISLILLNLTRNTPGAIRTRDPLLRRQMLYPAELQTHIIMHLPMYKITHQELIASCML